MNNHDSPNSNWSELNEARNRFISEIAQNMHLYGISQSVGRLYGTVFFAEKPMTLDQMSEALGMSKTSMSTGIRELSKSKMVERVWEKGVRKDLYQAEQDWYKSFSAVFINRWRKATELNKEAIQDTKQMLDELYDTTTDSHLQTHINRDLEKLDQAEAYYQWLDEVISLFESGEIFSIVPKK
ncbi:GbsR/MarR family transcriptional regulator [Desertibacillus haloalkaliphilus]|uniref:GbsR/MarR family transcriptional regulator n=1 Tax=Desertibacillus haloalkaliphilus TaxID=1328930 RepID=UPI001C278241|nr:GbsR/MarR family transcriptional regulator [Desertibacillus haloalkaliphilus]MBU8907458.1 GbsR/MarR family transcriptional regulator [Desertibacillus haloalkaliphilus]